MTSYAIIVACCVSHVSYLCTYYLSSVPRLKFLQAHIAQNSQQHNERLAALERQLKDTKDKLVQETELVVKLKKKNSELTKNVTQFDGTVREQKEKLAQLLAKCGAQERELASINTQLDQERQLSGKSGDRAQELQG